ncbi:MAG: hypothetical protein ACTSP1_17545 [Candidatus Freyarchaeota archaeon]
MVTLTTIELIRIAVIIISAACAVFLIRRYVENRQPLTLLLVSFFALIAVFFYFINIIYAGSLLVDPIMAELSFYAVSFGVVLLIVLAMLGWRELYFLPPLLTTIVIYQEYIFHLNRTYIINFFQFVSVISTGSPIGNPFFIVLKKLNPGLVLEGSINPGLLNLLFDPLSLAIPNVVIGIAILYLVVVGTVTIIFFSYLAWRNKSGRSLGFAIGLTIILVGGLALPTDVQYYFALLLGTLSFALGIFGALDRLISGTLTPKINKPKKRKK